MLRSIVNTQDYVYYIYSGLMKSFHNCKAVKQYVFKEPISDIKYPGEVIFHNKSPT